MDTNDTHSAFRLQRDDGTLLVRVRSDGTPEFGPGVTAETLWTTIAEALPAPPAVSPDTTMTVGLLVTLPEPETIRRGWSGYVKTIGDGS